jgi:hypothetical protein
LRNGSAPDCYSESRGSTPLLAARFKRLLALSSLLLETTAVECGFEVGTDTSIQSRARKFRGDSEMGSRDFCTVEFRVRAPIAPPKLLSSSRRISDFHSEDRGAIPRGATRLKAVRSELERQSNRFLPGRLWVRAPPGAPRRWLFALGSWRKYQTRSSRAKS